MKKNHWKSILLTVMAMLMMSTATVMAQALDEDFTAHWMSKLPSSTRICDLSIPMAHDAATWDALFFAFKDQQYDERTLFKKGVRAFDLRLGPNGRYRHGDKWLINKDLKSFEEEQSDHMPTLDQLKDEFMILFVQYEKNGDKSGGWKMLNKWAKALVDNEKNPYPLSSFVTYRPNLTLGDVRGKILVFGNCNDEYWTKYITDKAYQIPMATSSDKYKGYIFNSSLIDSTLEVKQANGNPYYFLGKDNVGTQEKIQDYKTCFKEWFDYYQTDKNKSDRINRIQLNSYSLPAYGADIASDRFALLGVNHAAYNFLRNYHVPYGIVQGDFMASDFLCGYFTYGCYLLNRILLNNFNSGITGTYIKDIHLCASTNADEAQAHLINDGYLIVGDANANTKSDVHVFIGVKETNDANEAIADIALYKGDGGVIPDNIKPTNGTSYVYAQYDNLDVEGWNGNINVGTGGDALYLYYTKSCADGNGNKAITGLQLSASTECTGNESTASLWDGSESQSDANINSNATKSSATYIHQTYHSHDFVNSYSDEEHYELCLDCGMRNNIVKHNMQCKQSGGFTHIDYCNECKYERLEDCSSANYDDEGFGVCDSCLNVCVEPAVVYNTKLCAISNPGQLYWFASEVNYDMNAYDATLTDEIVITDEILAKAPWIPIGTYNADDESYSGYRGTFNGAGFTVSGIKYDGSANSTLDNGLFGYVNEGTIRNLGIVNSSFSGKNNVGSLAGRMNLAKVENVFSTATVTGDESAKLGGLCGKVTDTSIRNGFFHGTASNEKSLGATSGECSVSNFFSPYTYDSYCNLRVIEEETFSDGTLLKILNDYVEEYNDDAEEQTLASWKQNVGEDAVPAFSIESIDNYLCFTAEENNTNVSINYSLAGSELNTPRDLHLQYSTDKVGWTNYTYGTAITLESADDCVYFRTSGLNEIFSGSDVSYFYFTADKPVAASGNIMSIIDHSMRVNTVPYLAFIHFFKDCINLTSAPELPATDLGEYCYYDMFGGCTGLTVAPTLPAKAMSYWNYFDMFDGCTNLNTMKVFFTDWADSEYDVNTGSWLKGVAPTGTFYYANGLDVTKRGEDYIPEGWTAVCMNPDVTLNSYGYATFSSAFDEAVKSGCNAYTVYYEDQNLKCEKITNGRIPAYSGVLLYGQPNATVTFNLTNGNASLGYNDLKPTTTATGLATKEESYTLSGNTFKYFAGSSYNANKAYLPKSAVGSGAKATLMMVFDDGTTTGISQVENLKMKVCDGKYLSNGRLIIIKGGKRYNAQGILL